MSDKNHEEEIAEINDLIEDLAAGNHSVFEVPAKTSRIMAREVMRLREANEKKEEKITRLHGLIINAHDGLGSAAGYLSSAKQLIEYGHL